MVSQKITLKNSQGFHMRPASTLASQLSKFKSEVTINYQDTKINAKSLLNIVAACIKCGSEIEIICNGEDEIEALATAIRLIEHELGD